MAEKGDIPVEELQEMYKPFDGEYIVSVHEGTQEVFVEDVNGLTVCHFNKYTQLPLTDENMEFEFNYWVDRAHQICDMLNYHWWHKDETR